MAAAAANGCLGRAAAVVRGTFGDWAALRHMSTIVSRQSTAAAVQRARRQALLEQAAAAAAAAAAGGVPGAIPVGASSPPLSLPASASPSSTTQAVAPSTGAAIATMPPPAASAASPPAQMPRRQRPVDAASLVARAAGDLAAAGRLHDETMAMIEASEEWRDYDAHVTFELNLLRHRYTVEAGAVGGGAMDTARRTQLQEHLRQKQAAVMTEHAEELASEMVALMTPEERSRLTAALWRVDAPEAAAAAAAALPAATAGPVAQLAAPSTPLRQDGGSADVGGGGGGAAAAGASAAEPR